MAKQSTRQSNKEWLAASNAKAQEREDEPARLSADRPARIARERELEAPIVRDLAEIGVNVRSIDDFDPSCSRLEAMFNVPRRTAPPVTSDVARILLKWLPRFQENDVDYAIQYLIIQALRYAIEPYDARPVVDCYMARPLLRDRISEMFSVTQPMGIGDWLVDVVGNRKYEPDCSWLVLVLARRVPPDTAIPILRTALNYDPAFSAMGLGEIGGPVEAAFLESFLRQPHDWESKETERWTCKKAEQAIRKIKKRADREAKLLANAKNKKRIKPA